MVNNSKQEYRVVSFDIAKPVIEKINHILEVSYNIKILVGRYEVERELKEKLEHYPYYPDGATPVQIKDTVYIIVGEEFYRRSKNTRIENTNGEEDISLPVTLVHEYLHIVLRNTLPETQERSYGLDSILENSVPINEFWTELFTHLFWRTVYGNKVPEHKYTLEELFQLYVEDIKEILHESKDIIEKLSNINRKILELEVALKLFDQGFKYIYKINDIFVGANSYEEVPENTEYYKSKNEVENKIKELRVKAYELYNNDNLWWMDNDKAYLFGAIIAKELWDRYGEDSIYMLIDRIKKYGAKNIDRILDKDIIDSAVSIYRSLISDEDMKYTPLL